MHSGSRILIVEDSDAIAGFYKEVLESEGHKVSVAIDGKEEIELYEKEMESCQSEKPPFDLIVSDNSMPILNGIEAGTRILDMMPNQKIFFVTANKNEVLDKFSVDGKNIDAAEKPIKIELFLKKVNLLIMN
ncbi:response regulator [Nitrosopumilus sp. b3]|uniref:response regulator n=1 Tax=Nitrosopumilus sp. b3 TaxID=2109909 RepID=UPI0015F5ACFB|nr:response regulator [Nitrosopumilus sp. b3]KAF6246130.1 response regulator [Nitrosopumilus sp. b3]